MAVVALRHQASASHCELQGKASLRKPPRPLYIQFRLSQSLWNPSMILQGLRSSYTSTTICYCTFQFTKNSRARNSLFLADFKPPTERHLDRILSLHQKMLTLCLVCEHRTLSASHCSIGFVMYAIRGLVEDFIYVHWYRRGFKDNRVAQRQNPQPNLHHFQPEGSQSPQCLILLKEYQPYGIK